jgi:hypothetical protein
MRISKWVIVTAAMLILSGAAMHLSAYARAVAAIGASNLEPFYANSFKLLWLGDSANLAIAAAILLALAARPQQGPRAILMLAALIPGATAILLYAFVGNFLPAHVLLATALMIAMAVPGLDVAKGK